MILPLALVTLLLAACGGGSAPDALPSDEAPASEAVSPSVAEEPSEAAEPSEATEPSAEAEPSEAADEEEVTVRLDGFAFDTTELTIPAGTEVTFLNTDAAAHTVTEGWEGQAHENPIINDEIAGGRSTTHTFDEPGTYQITCLFHPSMNMTVVVEG